jgi:uncharacterized membrane protein YkvA (DUF1232 family)
MFQKILTHIKKLKLEIQTLAIAYYDFRTPILAKLVISLTIGYFFSPIDLIPDFIPIFGLLDDLLIVPLLIWLSIKLLPQIVFQESRQKAINNTSQKPKNNWKFGCVVILTWGIVIYFLYKTIFK